MDSLPHNKESQTYCGIENWSSETGPIPPPEGPYRVYIIECDQVQQ